MSTCTHFDLYCSDFFFFRPLYLPLRALLTVESFSISSNIVTESERSMLRFIIEDAALYISDKVNKGMVDLRKSKFIVYFLCPFVQIYAVKFSSSIRLAGNIP